jgi:hypothetical protein
MKLPASIGSQIDGLLGNGAYIKQAESLLGNLASQIGKKIIHNKGE